MIYFIVSVRFLSQRKSHIDIYKRVRKDDLFVIVSIYWIYFSPIQIIDSSVQMFALPVSQYISTNINNTKGLNAATYLLSLAILTHIYTLYLDLSCYRKYFIKIKSMSCASCLGIILFPNLWQKQRIMACDNEILNTLFLLFIFHLQVSARIFTPG